MKIPHILNGFLLATLLAGCQHEPDPTSSPAPKVADEKILFQTNAPQLGYLAIEPAQEHKAAAIGLYGRLAWDEDVTVRVYSPVAGRVQIGRAHV